MRINKYFTDQGYCSRREADRLIDAGRVRINGRIAVLGDQVEDDDKVTVDGHMIATHDPKVYIMYHKPIGITCTTDKKYRSNIVDAVNHPLRVFPIGRLDRDSSGLIFLTNDGDIVNRILRAQYGHEKEYVVTVDRPYHADFLKKMENGVNIGGCTTKKCIARKSNDTTFSIVLTEGKNRQIRRMCEALGYEVTSLQRVRIMNVRLGHLKPGKWKDIPKRDMEKIWQSISEKTSPDEDIDVEE